VYFEILLSNPEQELKDTPIPTPQKKKKKRIEISPAKKLVIRIFSSKLKISSDFLIFGYRIHTSAS